MWLTDFLKWILYIVARFIYRIAKFFMRKVTRLTELQRIMYGELKGCRRFRKIEASLNASRSFPIRHALVELKRGVNDGRFDSRGTRTALLTRLAVQITNAKNINNLKFHSGFVTDLTECLEVIYAFKSLEMRVELLRSTEYSSNDDEHEEKLMELWDKMMPGVKLSGRRSRQWADMGFQGRDPATDFRGAGFLALETLLYISNSYPEVARRLLENSHHPRYGYPYALVVIQMTYLGCQLCQQGLAKTHFYNRYPTILTLGNEAGPLDSVLWGKELLNLFYELVTCFVIDFDAMWMSSKPRNIMDYSLIKTKFDLITRLRLEDDATCFLMERRRHYAVFSRPHVGVSVVSLKSGNEEDEENSTSTAASSFTSFEFVYQTPADFNRLSEYELGGCLGVV